MNLFDRCIEALGKQEPKRPLLVERFYQCPVCGGGEEYLVYETDIYIRYNYCANCGQRLKWEGVDDGRK